MCLPHENSMKPTDHFRRTPDLEIDTSLTSSDKPVDATQWGTDLKCYMCEKVVDFVFKELDKRQTRDYIKVVLNRTCSHLFRNEDKEVKCEKYVNTYTDRLIDLIEKADNPALICNVSIYDFFHH